MAYLPQDDGVTDWRGIVADLLNKARLLGWGQPNVQSYPKGGISSHPKNVPGRVDMRDAIQRGMARPKRPSNDYPMPGRRVT